ncbi:MAG: hypothetical protein ACOY94_20695 [Bacillota bacterium]
MRVNPGLREKNAELYAHAKWYGIFDPERSVTLLDTAVVEFFALDTDGFIRRDGKVVIPFGEQPIDRVDRTDKHGGAREKPAIDSELLRLQDGVARWRQRAPGQEDVRDYIRRGAFYVISYLTSKWQIAQRSELQWQWRQGHICFDDERAVQGGVVLQRGWPADHLTWLVEVGYTCSKPDVKEAQRQHKIQMYLQQTPAVALSMGELTAEWTRKAAAMLDNLSDVQRIILAAYTIGVQLATPERRITPLDLGKAYSRLTTITADFWADLCAEAHGDTLRLFAEQWGAFRTVFSHFFMEGDLVDLHAIDRFRGTGDLLEWAYNLLCGFPRKVKEQVAPEWVVGETTLRDLVETAWFLGHRFLDGEGSVWRQQHHRTRTLTADVERTRQVALELYSPELQAEAAELRRLSHYVHQLNPVFGPQLLTHLETLISQERELKLLVERCDGLLGSIPDDNRFRRATPMLIAGGHRSITGDAVSRKITDLLVLLEGWGSAEPASVGSIAELEEVLYMLGKGGVQ